VKVQVGVNDDTKVCDDFSDISKCRMLKSGFIGKEAVKQILLHEKVKLRW